MKTEASEYLSLLQEIQNNNVSTFTVMPADEPRFTIETNSRNIIVPSEFSFLSVQNDHRAETIYFEIDRYFDNVDLSQHACVVQFINKSGTTINEGTYPVTSMDIDSVDGKIVFGWEIRNDATQLTGDITFSVRFYSIDNNGNFIYNFNTLTASSYILPSLNIIASGERITATELEVWTDKMNNLASSIESDIITVEEKIEELENYIASIPEDYTALTEEVGKLSEENAKLKGDIDNIVRGNQPFAIVKDEYVNINGEIRKTDQKWDRTDYIEINNNLVIISKSSSVYNCFFDSSKSFVSNFPLSNGENKIIVPDNAKYIICSNTSDAIKELIVKSDNSARITDLENDTEAHEIALKSRKNLIGTIPNKFYPIDYKANENITFSTKGLVPVTKSHIFYFYDENKEYVTDYALFPPLEKRTVYFDKDAKYILLKIEQEYPIQVEYGETATEYEDYLLKSSDLTDRVTNLENDTSIITLNKQLEPFVIQSTATKASGFGSSLKPLTFIHFSDWHNVPVIWERLCDYMEEYKDYIQFALHTGDYCGNWQGNYTDAYLLKNTTNPILNCVGNHDTYTQEMKKNTQESAYKLLFNHIDNWGVTFGSGNNTMYYYKDFPDSEIRLIVLDCYYDIDNQKTWLEEKLNEAKDLNYAVITAMHEVSKSIVDKIQCTFQTLDNYESAGGNVSAGAFDAIIKAFKDNGGVHIVNLCGHEHDDMFGYTSNGVLNLVVECATTWNGWTGGKRIEGTKTYDCFNVFSVEKDTGIFKVVRIGDNSDHYLRAKNILSYDYVNKRVLYNV